VREVPRVQICSKIPSYRWYTDSFF